MHTTTRPVPVARTNAPRTPASVRIASITAAAWAAAFAALNGWVQIAAADADALAGSVVGLAVLNGVAVVLKGVGVAAALRSLRPLDGVVGHLTALVLVATTSTLALWGVLAVVAAVVEGSLTGTTTLAGGLVTIPGWAYGTAFLAGAAAFGPPAVHAARAMSLPRRHVLGAAAAGPVLAVGTIVATAAALQALGLLVIPATG